MATVLLSACYTAPPAAKPPEAIARQIEDYFGLATGTPHRVLRIENRSNLYLVTLLPDSVGARPLDVFVTLDGRYVFEQQFELAKRRESLQADKRFAQCLLDKGVRLYVDPAAAETKEQYAQLGFFAHTLSIDCGDKQAALCSPHVADKLPALMMGKKIAPGVHPRAWVEAFAGCK